MSVITAHQEYMATLRKMDREARAANEVQCVIESDAGLIPLWYVIFTTRAEQVWQVVRIEVYADKAQKVLLCDDLQIDSLPLASRVRIYTELNQAQALRRTQERIQRNIKPIRTSLPEGESPAEEYLA